MGGSSGAALIFMILYRTSNPKRRHSLAFLVTQRQQTALLAQLEKQSWIDEVFNRTLPIPAQYPTRFGPAGFNRNVFYASERRETTFFEFGYGLLKAQSVIGRGIAAVCFEVMFRGRRDPDDVSSAENLEAILNPKGYQGAHQWLLALSAIPESVRYPSVREPGGDGVNLAIYEPEVIVGTRAQIEDLILTPQSTGSVDVESLSRGRLSTIDPIR
ncbi:RES family NAD+ phosphorylase [Bdellovibrionota bacterium FG-1]